MSDGIEWKFTITEEPEVNQLYVLQERDKDEYFVYVNFQDDSDDIDWIEPGKYWKKLNKPVYLSTEKYSWYIDYYDYKTKVENWKMEYQKYAGRKGISVRLNKD